MYSILLIISLEFVKVYTIAVEQIFERMFLDHDDTYDIYTATKYIFFCLWLVEQSDQNI